MTLIDANHPVLLVGAGKMGGAMLSGWLNSGRPAADFYVVDPAPSAEISAFLNEREIRLSGSLQKGLTPSAVILAVKPQMMAEVLPALAPLKAAQPVFVSIAAGTAVSTFQDAFGPKAAIVRAMPNTPAQVGRGVTAGYATPSVNDQQKAEIANLLSVTGAFEWVHQEALIDAVTALSGSGPAYIFHMVEALARAGEAAGLEADLSLRLARATVEGSGELLYQAEEAASQLRKNVTSPGGTTAAALDVLMDEASGLTTLMTKAVLAAKARAEELGQN